MTLEVVDDRRFCEFQMFGLTNVCVCVFVVLVPEQLVNSEIDNFCALEFRMFGLNILYYLVWCTLLFWVSVVMKLSFS